MSETIPTLDLKEYSTNKEEFVSKIGTAYEGYGFAAIVNHGIDDSIIEEARQSIQQFFNLDTHLKMAYYQEGQGGARGYTPFMIETAKDSNYPDLKEFWHVGREITEDMNVPATMYQNIWPKELENFKNSTLRLYDSLDKLGIKLLRAIALFLDLDEYYFDDKVNMGNSILRPIHYPPIETETKSVRSGQHEDINVITLLVGSEQPGLEILSKTNEWIPVTSIEGAIVCNIGDMLQRLTNNRLKSTTHRVVNPPGNWSKKPRYSIPFFLHFNSDFLIKTLNSCINKEYPNLYPESILADDYLHERLVEIGLIKE